MYRYVTILIFVRTFAHLKNVYIKIIKHIVKNIFFKETFRYLYSINKSLNLFKDACENIKCGANAECTPERHSGQCNCKYGYIGNGASDKGCQLQEIKCKNKTECSAEHYCHNGICQGNNFIRSLY